MHQLEAWVQLIVAVAPLVAIGARTVEILRRQHTEHMQTMNAVARALDQLHDAELLEADQHVKTNELLQALLDRQPTPQRRQTDQPPSSRSTDADPQTRRNPHWQPLHAPNSPSDPAP